MEIDLLFVLNPPVYYMVSIPLTSMDGYNHSIITFFDVVKAFLGLFKRW